MATTTPPSLNTYELYKKATNEVVTWLVQKGAASGYGNPKSKSKFPNRYLQKCAEAISRKPTIEIPGRIIDTMDDVIIGRQIYVTWFGEKHGSNQESNDTHQHFLGIMRDIRQLLVEARKERKSTSPAPRASTLPAEQTIHAPEKSLANFFQHLRLEETSGNANDSKGPKSAKPTQANAEPTELLVEVDPEEDKRFAIFCYLQDQAAIRAFVKETWQQYAQGEISFFVATTVVEEAYSCMYREQTTLDPMNDMLKFLHVEAQYQEIAGKIQVTFVDIDTRETSALSELLCPTAYVFLTGMMHEWNIWDEESKADSCDKYVPSLAAVDFAAKTRPFLQRLLLIIPELCRFVHQQGVGGPNTRNMEPDYQIVLIRSLGLTQLMGHVLICPVMILQSYIEMFDILGDRADFAVEEYSETVEQIQAAFKEVVKFKESHAVSKTLNRDAELCLPYMAQFVEEEVVFKTALMTKEVSSSNSHNSALARHSRIARCLPTALVMRVSLLKRRMHDFEHVFANDGVIVPAMAYLYRVARWYEKVSLWPDLERMIELQTKATGSSFVKDILLHGDAIHYTHRVYLFCFGVSAQSKANNSAVSLDQKMTKIHSGVEWAQLCVKHQERSFFGVDVTKDGGEVNWATKDRTTRVILQDIARSAHNSSKDKPSTFTSLECLAALKQAWIRDEPEINFSYLGLWMPLAEILGNLRKIIAKNPTKHVRQMDVVVWADAIPQIMTEAYIAHSVDKRFKEDKEMKRARLVTAAFMMEKVIKSSGDRYTKRSEERSGGRCIGPDPSSVFQEVAQSSDGAVAVDVPDAEERDRFREWLQAPLKRHTGLKDCKCVHCGSA